MDEKTQQEILNLTKENNKILRGMRSSQRWSGFFRVVYWLFIISSIISAYYLVQPKIDSIKNGYQDVVSGVGDTADSLKLAPEDIQSLKNALGI